MKFLSLKINKKLDFPRIEDFLVSEKNFDCLKLFMKMAYENNSTLKKIKLDNVNFSVLHDSSLTINIKKESSKSPPYQLKINGKIYEGLNDINNTNSFIIITSSSKKDNCVDICKIDKPAILYGSSAKKITITDKKIFSLETYTEEN